MKSNDQLMNLVRNFRDIVVVKYVILESQKRVCYTNKVKHRSTDYNAAWHGEWYQRDLDWELSIFREELSKIHCEKYADEVEKVVNEIVRPYVNYWSSELWKYIPNSEKRIRPAKVAIKNFTEKFDSIFKF